MFARPSEDNTVMHTTIDTTFLAIWLIVPDTMIDSMVHACKNNDLSYHYISCLDWYFDGLKYRNQLIFDNENAIKACSSSNLMVMKGFSVHNSCKFLEE